MERKIYKVFYTGEHANGSRLEDVMIVEAVDIPTAIRIAKHYLNLWGVKKPLVHRAIENK